MRFNKQELTALATQPSQKFDKEGVLFLRERQEGFFRRTDRKDGRRGRRSLGSRDLSCVGGLSKVHLERWCRLRGNLLFYFKSRDQWSEPLGVIVLQQSDIKVDPPGPDGPYGFTLVFEGGASQHLSAGSEGDRDAWLLAIQAAGYGAVRATLLALEQRLEARRRQDPNLDVHMWRLRVGKTVDPCELPLCEVSLACDNLLCDGHGRPPNPVLVVHISVASPPVWVKYAKTELVERSSNPVFLTTVCFRAGDGISAETRVRLTAHDLREPVSETATLIGSATVDMRTIQETDRLRIPLRSAPGTTVGFVSLAVWSLEREERGGSTESTPCRTPPEAVSAAAAPPHTFGHRRSQSLPPTLGCRLRLPAQGALGLLFAGPFVQTYRFHSGLGGDISVHELMAESRLAFAFPQQLLGVWIQEEKELLQEVAAMGELREPWHSRQVELLDRHLHLLHLYSQAKEHLAAHKGSHFKASARKNERALEFAPVNLHLQRMWAHNDTLRCSGLYDVVTVGAFTAHSHKSKNGGLLRLLQAGKESRCEPREPRKTEVALDAITAIKTLRREVVDGMRQLMRLARDKQPAGMLPICDDMIGKTRALLGLWDPGLVEEALAFVEEHKVPQTALDESDEGVGLEAPRRALSPYRRITQRLRLELRCPDSLDELATPDSPRRAAPFWDLATPDNAVSSYGPADFAASPADNETQFVIFPDADDSPRSDTVRDSPPKDADDDGIVPDGACNGGECRRFLDTAAMSSSPTANYYKPTDEPEPWDLTQLNIEASVMCLVSKVKFLCGRCGSPAVRLRSRGSMSRSRSFRSGPAPAEPVAVVTAQPARRMTFAEGAGLSADMTGEEVIDKVAATVTASVCARNKFTDGLDFASITDWAGELRPAMRKLRQAMDGLLKTARLTHSVFRVQEDARAAQRACNVQYRRDVCFAQALTSLAAGLSARLWCRRADPGFIAVLAALGPLASFQGLLSHCGDEVDMWGDMVVAVEDLVTVTFTITRVAPTKRPEKSWLPRAVGSRAALTVLLPAPDSVIALLPRAAPLSFKVTPVFFNVGINEMATLAESLGNTKPQDKSNADNAERLAEYHRRYRRLALPGETNVRRQPPLPALVQRLRDAAAARTSKNVDVLHLSAHICRRMKGLRFTSCKSAKDRTGMSVTLEQSQILAGEYDLSEHEHQRALDCMRSEGCRRENACKNTGVRRYAFNSLQLLTLPRAYRPPAGTYGSAQT